MARKDKDKLEAINIEASAATRAAFASLMCSLITDLLIGLDALDYFPSNLNLKKLATTFTRLREDANAEINHLINLPPSS